MNSNIVIQDGVSPAGYAALRLACGMAELDIQKIEQALKHSLFSLSARSFALVFAAESAPYGTWIIEKRTVSGRTNWDFLRL